LLGASDVDGDPLTYAVVASPAHGDLDRNSADPGLYSGVRGYSGADSFGFLKPNDGTTDSASCDDCHHVTASATASIEIMMPTNGKARKQMPDPTWVLTMRASTPVKNQIRFRIYLDGHELSAPDAMIEDGRK